MEACQKALLENFRVYFDNFYSELDLHNSGKVENSYKELMSKGMLYEKEGAMWFKSSKFGDDQDRVIKKADGSNTYLTADIAYHVDKLKRGYDRLINIWGADHHGYVARVKASLEALGYDPNKLEILLGQLVNLVINGEEVRMGKRKNMVTLDDLIEEVECVEMFPYPDGDRATAETNQSARIATANEVLQKYFDEEIVAKGKRDMSKFYVMISHYYYAGTDNPRHGTYTYYTVENSVLVSH